MAFLHHLIVDFVIKLGSSALLILNESESESAHTRNQQNAIYLSIILAWRDLFSSLLIKTCMKLSCFLSFEQLVDLY